MKRNLKVRATFPDSKDFILTTRQIPPQAGKSSYNTSDIPSLTPPNRPIGGNLRLGRDLYHSKEDVERYPNLLFILKLHSKTMDLPIE